MSERTPDAGDEMNRELFMNPSIIGDSMESPLLDQARENVEEEAIDNLERDRAEREARKKPPEKRTVDGITFATGPDEQ